MGTGDPVWSVKQAGAVVEVLALRRDLEGDDVPGLVPRVRRVGQRDQARMVQGGEQEPGRDPDDSLT